MSNLRRYGQLLALVLAAGVIYPLVYLRQNFEGTMLVAFDISIVQLGQCYSLLGVLFVATYLPSGWLADKLSPRVLICFSLAATSLLGFWYWTLPTFPAMLLIFGGWGLSTGLTFWAALIKETNLIAGPDHQGRFFGILEAGRGLVEALLASLAVGLFAWLLTLPGTADAEALQQVMLMYVSALAIMAVVTWFTLDGSLHDAAGRNSEIYAGADAAGSNPEIYADADAAGSNPEIQAGADAADRNSEIQMGADSVKASSNLLRDLAGIFSNREVWLAAFCILCGYSLFYTTYSFAGYLQTELALSAVAVGWVTVGRQWMRPIGGLLAGFIADRFNLNRVLSITLALSGLGLVAVASLPSSTLQFSGAGLLIVSTVLAASLMTYSARAIYWGTLESCNLPDSSKGLAIGAISLIGYSPEIWVPLLNGYLVDAFPGRLGYAIYYCSMALLGLAGALAAYRLMNNARVKSA